MTFKLALQLSALAAPLGLALLLSASPANAQSVAAPKPAVQDTSRADALEQTLIGLSEDVLAAQRAFDQTALAALLAPDYVEVSPVGEVDRRAEVLGFYSAEAKAKALPEGAVAPILSLDESIVRVSGDHASVVARETISMAGHSMALRVGFHFRRIDGEWRLHSAQYTPIRMKPPAH